jgi:hypothetical protein
MAQANRDLTPSDPSKIKPPSRLSLEEVFQRWRTRLGSSENAKDELYDLLCSRDCRSLKKQITADGEEIYSRLTYEFWRDTAHLVVEWDVANDIDHIVVRYPQYVHDDIPCSAGVQNFSYRLPMSSTGKGGIFRRHRHSPQINLRPSPNLRTKPISIQSRSRPTTLSLRRICILRQRHRRLRLKLLRLLSRGTRPTPIHLRLRAPVALPQSGVHWLSKYSEMRLTKFFRMASGAIFEPRYIKKVSEHSEVKALNPPPKPDVWLRALDRRKN